MTTTPTPLVTREALLAFTQRLVVMPFEGRHLAKIREMRRLCQVRFPLDLLVRRPEEIEVRYRGGAIRLCARRLTMASCCMAEPWSAVPEWIAKAEGDWEDLEILLTRNTPGLRDAVLARYPGFETSAEEQAELVELASKLRQALRILLSSEQRED